MPRQRYQDPTVKQAENGSYFIRPWVDVMTSTGLARKRKTIVLGPEGMKARDVKAAKIVAMEKVNRAGQIIQSQVGFGDLLKEFDTRHIERRLGVAAQGKYRSLLKNHVAPAFGAMQLYEVTAQRVEEYLDKATTRGKGTPLSWATKTDIRNVLSCVFRCAKDWKLYQDENPIAGVYVGKKKAARQHRKLTDDETRRLLATLPADVRTMVCVALFCTLRISEVLGLQEKHFDFAASEINVEQRFYRGDLDTTKTEKSQRTVPMGYLADELKLLCMGDPERFVFQVATRPQWGKKAGISRDDRDILQHFIRPAAEAIKCYWLGFGWHSFRREAITAISGSLGVAQAMRAAGHTRADMSLAYTLQDRNALRDAVQDRQNKFLGEGTKQ